MKKQPPFQSVVGERKLSPEQLADAWVRIAAGDTSAEGDIVAHHLGIVRVLLRKFNLEQHEDECASAALGALLKAVCAFDPKRKTKFSSFAWGRISNAIRSCLHYHHARCRYNQVVRVGLHDEFYESEDRYHMAQLVDRKPLTFSEPDLAAAVIAAIEDLPKKLRLAATMRFLEGQPFQAIATALGRESRGSGFHMVRRAAHMMRPDFVDYEPGRENCLSKRKVRELIEAYVKRLAEEAQEKAKMKRRAHHVNSCPQCGHTHRGQIDVGGGNLKCKRCGCVHRAKAEEGKA